MKKLLLPSKLISLFIILLSMNACAQESTETPTVTGQVTPSIVLSDDIIEKFQSNTRLAIQHLSLIHI